MEQFMNRAKIFIASTFLLAFAVCVSAQEQTPKIVWKNLREKYESFYDIKPQIINDSGSSIYYDSYYFPYIDFERFDEKSNSWKISSVWHCGTGYKPKIEKVKITEQIPFNFGESVWNEILNEDSIGVPQFRNYPEYNGTGKYRLSCKFGTKKSNANQLTSYSPEFEVIEKNFKK
jgi:hypothetical protein